MGLARAGMSAAGTMAGTMANVSAPANATAQSPQMPTTPMTPAASTAPRPQIPPMPGPNVWNSANANVTAGAIAL